MNGHAVNVDINDLMQYSSMELRLMIEWARKVPGKMLTNFLRCAILYLPVLSSAEPSCSFSLGFSDLMIEDQMALLKGSFMELNVLRLSYR